MPNRLARERSPYLLQHAENPVDWYPWGKEAFEKARRDDRPIFLSIGYSTCHWCHVMAHESFEDAGIAAALNRDFVPVKVDREERPDVDRVYMAFVQATTGGGGWPMSVWLTPDLKPFYGGTYFPPVRRWNHPAFPEVLAEISRLWREDRRKIVDSAESLLERLRPVERLAGGDVAPADALAGGVAQFRAAYDTRRGGFGDAPKFPRPSELLFLLREHARTGDTPPRDMAVHALRAMALGGLRDHVGGGFHRYTVDGDWRIPHFEKMLYDQAQLVLAYLEAAQVMGDRFFGQVADDTLQYVRREMTDPAGGFHSAEDADSVPPGSPPGTPPREGAFYVWTAEELRGVLGDDYDVFAARFGVRDGGNAPSDPQGEFTGQNLLYTALPVDAIATRTRRSRGEVIDALSRARLHLFGARLQRPRPSLDDKVLTAWNGLMIAAFARAARVLRSPRLGGSPETAAAHLAAARRAAGFLRDRMWDPARGVLRRRFRAGDSDIDGYAEDYAAAVWGALELFQSTGEPEWLEWASTLQARMDALFGDPEFGGWFSTTGDDQSVLLRLKEDYDGAEPSATAIGAMNLLTLTHLRPDEEGLARAQRSIALFGPRLGEFARAVPMMMAVLSTWHAGLSQVVVVGRADAPDTRALLDALAETYRPFALVVPIDPERTRDALARLLPFVATMTTVDGRAAAYVCRDFTCRAPVTSPAALAEALQLETAG